jgi:hypothetical protein
MRLKSIITAALLLMVSPALSQDPEQREAIALDPAEHGFMLGEMHRNMTALQVFLSAMAESDLKAAQAAALSRGTAAFAIPDPNRPPGLSAKLTPAWRALAGEGRMLFDALARDPTMGRLAALLGNCNACHATIRLVVK